MNELLIQTGKQAKQGAYTLACLSTSVKNDLLLKIADHLDRHAGALVKTNEEDLKRAREVGTSESMLDRLMIDEKRIKGMTDGLRSLTALQDPIGETIEKWTLDNGLSIEKRRVPLGVIGIIYEARPNVTVDAAGICLKSGNAVILKGGKEAANTNRHLVLLMQEALKEMGHDPYFIQLLDVYDREITASFMKLGKYVDVLIPRGGSGLIKAVLANATIPVIETGAGNCHVFVDESADLEMATNIIINAKTQRPSVCNAIEKVLIHSEVAEIYLGTLVQQLRDKGVDVHGCDRVHSMMPDVPVLEPADWYEEFLALKIGIKIVDTVAQAIEHINEYSTHHSESIITKSDAHANDFVLKVDSAAVYVNASTRFTDGGEFGYGAEIGISTQKLHARGPMGLKEMTTYKNIIMGCGQVRK